MRCSVGLALCFEHLFDTLEGPANTAENVAGQGMSSNAHFKDKSTLILDWLSLKGSYSGPILVGLIPVFFFHYS